MLTIGNIRRSCRCLIISMVFKHGVCSVNRILLISYIILFIYSFHYITFRFTIFWSFHNSFLVTCPSSFLFHIWFDFYVPSTYCTTTFYLDLIINMQSSLNWWILKLESSATCYLDNDGLVFKYAIMLSRTDLSDAHFKLSEDVHAFASLKAHAFLQQVLLSFQEEALAFDSTTYSSPSFPMAFLKVFTFWRWIFFNYNCNVSCSIYSMHV